MYLDTTADTIAIYQAIHQAGHVAELMAQGLTVSDLARRLGVSRSTAWRLAERAREQIKAELT